MDITYSKDGDKLKEVSLEPKEVSYSYSEILANIENAGTEKVNYTAKIDARIAEWTAKKAEAVKLGLDS